MPTHIARRGLIAAAVASCTSPGRAAAPDRFPSRPVRLVVPFAAGAALDGVARVLARALEARWGQPVVVENRSGAGGNIGAAAVAGAAPDGHALLVATAGLIAVNPHLYRDPGYDPVHGLSPVALLGSLPNVMVVPEASPARDVAGFVAAMRAGARPMLYGSPGSGSFIHVTGALFARESGLAAEHVAYRGSAPALADLVAGRLDAMFENLPGALPLLRDGRLRALAVTSPERSPVLPDLPTMAEAGLPGVVAVPWFALYAPGGTPAALRARLAADVASVQDAPESRRLLEGLGLTVQPSGPEALGAMAEGERERLGRVVRDADIRVE